MAIGLIVQEDQTASNGDIVVCDDRRHIEAEGDS